MKRKTGRILTGAILILAAATVGQPAGETVSTVVYSRVGNGYERKRSKDGAFKPEHYALSNGGRIEGTSRDNTVDRVTYPEVAEIASRLLAQQNYYYAQSKEQAKLLLVLNWGATLSYNTANYSHAVQELSKIVRIMAEEKQYRPSDAPPKDTAVDAMAEQLLMIKIENSARDARNLPNAKVLGYLDAINDADGVQRWAGGGDAYKDLLADIEESRYYIIISAYDFPELTKKGTRKLLWQTRVSVRSPGNRFDHSMVPMLKSASKYFGQDSGRLVRGEETMGTVEMGDLKILGEEGEKEKSPTKESK